MFGDVEAFLLHNYNPNFERGCEWDVIDCEKCENGSFEKCHIDRTCCEIYIGGGIRSHEGIEVSLKIDGDKIECHDLSE